MSLAKLARIFSTPLPIDAWPGQPSVSIVRGDLIHPVVSGNKIYKLLPLLKQAHQQNVKRLVSVGGRFSNHLHALSWAGHLLGFKTVGFYRSYTGQELTPTLRDCLNWGMTLHAISPQQYQARDTEAFWSLIENQYPQSAYIREGGWSADAIEGSSAWWQSIPKSAKTVVLPVGSGTTMVGLLANAPENVRVIGVPVYRDPDGYQALHERLSIHNRNQTRFELWGGYAGKGFGRSNSNLIQFAEQFERQSGVKLDLVYNAKSFYALFERLMQNDVAVSEGVAILHTGGLQGLRK